MRGSVTRFVHAAGTLTRGISTISKKNQIVAGQWLGEEDGARRMGIGQLSRPYELGETLATETSLEVDPRPSTFGARVTMAATVTVPARVADDEDLAEQPNTGRVMFIDGGTCASPTTVLAEGVAIFNGKASFSTTALAVGTHSMGRATWAAMAWCRAAMVPPFR
jgi:hypothetical protein